MPTEVSVIGGMHSSVHFFLKDLMLLDFARGRFLDDDPLATELVVVVVILDAPTAGKATAAESSVSSGLMVGRSSAGLLSSSL